jgi:hypothetical protein
VQLLGNILMGLGGLFGLLGILLLWVPVVGLLLFGLGIGLWAIGRFVRHHGRRHAVIKRQGGQGIF